jgi:RNA polymerase sigma-70 factor (ECF subfamily)
MFAFRSHERPVGVLTAARAGEIERLYREHGPKMWRALLAYSGDPEVASDAVAEAFAQALRRGHGIREPLRWIWRAAFRIARGELKERRRVAIAEVSASYELEEPAVELVQALAKLSSRQRAAVALFYLADYPVKEVAEMLGTSASAVRVYLTRGRRRLRALLEDDDEDR